MNQTQEIKPALQQAKEAVSSIKMRQERAPTKSGGANRPDLNVVAYVEGEGGKIGVCWLNNDKPGGKPKLEIEVEKLRFLIEKPDVQKLVMHLLPSKTPSTAK